MIWVLKGPGPEMAERHTLAGLTRVRIGEPVGKNTAEEADHIAQHSWSAEVIYVVTSAYHVSRAYLTILRACRACGLSPVLHVWGTGTVTNLQMQSEAKKLAEAQVKGHALRWEDV